MYCYSQVKLKIKLRDWNENYEKNMEVTEKLAEIRESSCLI